MGDHRRDPTRREVRVRRRRARSPARDRDRPLAGGGRRPRRDRGQGTRALPGHRQATCSTSTTAMSRASSPDRSPEEGDRSEAPRPGRRRPSREAPSSRARRTPWWIRSRSTRAGSWRATSSSRSKARASTATTSSTAPSRRGHSASRRAQGADGGPRRLPGTGRGHDPSAPGPRSRRAGPRRSTRDRHHREHGKDDDQGRRGRGDRVGAHRLEDRGQPQQSLRRAAHPPPTRRRRGRGARDGDVGGRGDRAPRRDRSSGRRSSSRTSRACTWSSSTPSRRSPTPRASSTARSAATRPRS